ncbi:17556_t:CDS:1, partial [Racocetra persica]
MVAKKLVGYKAKGKLNKKELSLVVQQKRELDIDKMKTAEKVESVLE